jgi:Glu-tRNA(Gln) amidotransferase subunit E-like FAD-binding protein
LAFSAVYRKNKREFNKLFEEEHAISKIKMSRNESKLIKLIKAIKQNERRLTDDDVEYLEKVIELIEIGGISKNTVRTILSNIKAINEPDMFKWYSEIKRGIPYDLFKKLEFKSSANIDGPREIILSEYLVGR